MTYGLLQQACACYGFVDTPLTHEEYLRARDLGVNEEEMYGLACDVACGVEFEAALDAALRAQQENAGPPPGAMSFTTELDPWDGADLSLYHEPFDDDLY